jgi:hypothetical protein
VELKTKVVVAVNNFVHLERYRDALDRLSHCGYVISSAAQGYIVMHLTDADDVSHCRHLGDLVDLADLFEWREQRKAKICPREAAWRP